jgi:hypothetical protein
MASTLPLVHVPEMPLRISILLSPLTTVYVKPWNVMLKGPLLPNSSSLRLIILPLVLRGRALPTGCELRVGQWKWHCGAAT